MKVTIVADMYIESAQDMIRELSDADIAAQAKEFREAVPNASDDKVTGFLLGLQTARVFIMGSPNAGKDL